MNDCACVYIGDADGPEFYTHEMRRARKEHKCSECGDPITKGTEYEYFAGKWDGDFSEHKTCPNCLAVNDAFFCDGRRMGGMWYDLRQHIVHDMKGRISSECLVNLPKAMREVVCDLIEEAWSLYDEKGRRIDEKSDKEMEG